MTVMRGAAAQFGAVTAIEMPREGAGKARPAPPAARRGASPSIQSNPTR